MIHRYMGNRIHTIGDLCTVEYRSDLITKTL